MTEIKPPGKLPKTVFLAGSIEMGEAENWCAIDSAYRFRTISMTRLSA